MIEAVENRFIFFPTPASEEWVAPPSPRFEDVYLTIAEGVTVHAWWCPREIETATGPVLIYLHGNSGNISTRGPSCLRWQEELNAAVLIIDYPGYGRSTGRPSESSCYATADAAFEWLIREKRVTPERVLIYGGSLGGAVAVELATQRPHRALILVNTFLSVREMGRAIYPALPMMFVHDRFNSLAKIAKCPRPVFVAHATQDRVVPFAHGRKLFEAANEPKQFFALEGNDHHDPAPKEFYAALRSFLAQAC